MKETLNKLYLNSKETHLPTSDCNIDGYSESPIPTPKGLSSGAESEFYTDLKNDQFKLTPLIHKKLLPACISSIPFIHILEHLQAQDRTQDKKWGDTDPVSTHNTEDSYVDNCTSASTLIMTWQPSTKQVSENSQPLTP